MKRILLLLIFVFPAGLSAPSVMGTLRGRVTDRRDRPVAKALIALISAEGRVTLGTSNAQGEYAIHDLSPGRYAIWAAQNSRSLFDRSGLEINHGEIEEIDISLAPGPGRPRSAAGTLRLPMELAFVKAFSFHARRV